MSGYKVRHHLRLDEKTEEALEQIVKHTFATKCAIMRRYIQQGVRQDVAAFSKEAADLMTNTKVLKDAYEHAYSGNGRLR